MSILQSIFGGKDYPRYMIYFETNDYKTGNRLDGSQVISTSKEILANDDLDAIEEILSEQFEHGDVLLRNITLLGTTTEESDIHVQLPKG